MTFPLNREAWSHMAPSATGLTAEIGASVQVSVATRGLSRSRLMRLERIYTAATESVAANGFQGLSMDDIAMRAGCSRATVYRRVGDKEAIRDVVLNQAVARISSSVAQAVSHLDGQERIVAVIIASLDTIRADPVSAALLAGAEAACSVDSAVISRFAGAVADLTGIRHDDTVACELVSRLILALLCWPVVDCDTEAHMIRRLVSPGVAGVRSMADPPEGVSAVASLGRLDTGQYVNSRGGVAITATRMEVK